MSHLNVGLISTYNSLTDKHLAGYFSNTRIRRHLQRAGLITRSGRIVPDKEYRHKLIQRAHQRHVRECLAQAIFHKVLEMERLHQIEIKRKLEEFARRERVRKIKVERSKRYEEGFVHILSPRPPTGARGIWKQHSGPEGEHSESSESPSSSRPNTAPGKMQRPVRLKPIHSNSTTASVRHSSPYRLLESSHENDVPFNCTMEKEPRRRLTAVEASHGISPYCLPVINNFVTPVPPATKRKERGLKVTPSSTVRGRRLHPTTASSGADDTPVLRSSVHQSRVCVNMVYFGKTVRLSNDLTDTRDEVRVFQQHCGGENLCVYKGKLHEGETFQFISRRHRGFPFSLTFFLNGLQVERLSSCCEFKHRKGSRLGGKHGHFGFSSVEGAAPCYKCIIAMGLDKKPTPPPKRVKEDIKREESVSSPKYAPEMEMERTEEDAGSHSACETSQPHDTETPVKEETAPEEDKDRDDYEEDFEADDERPAEEEKEEKSPSPSSEMESQVKEKDASETDNDEKDEDTRSHSGSSSSGSERDESDAEDTKDIKEDKKAEQPREDSQVETVAQPVEKDEPNPEEAAATEAESCVAKDSHMDSAGDSTEIEISDISVPSGSDTRQSDDKDAEKMIEESKHEEEQERAKSVQEKLAEAILKEAQCSSEPELSDTSTEEEEESTHKGRQQDNKDAAPDKPVTFTEQQQTIAEETKCEESDTGKVVVAQEQQDSPETKEQSDDEQEPHENRDSTEDEKAEEDEKAAEDEATAEKDKSEERGEALHLLKEENLAQDDTTTKPLEETPAETIDDETVGKDEEKVEKTAVEADVQCDETGQGAKSREENESSVSEPDEKTDETAVPDNAEVETMTARETIEIKAESSEEREALSCEEAPVTDAEKREPADSEDGAAASETEVTAENSSSSANGSGETTVEKVAYTSEENRKDESSKDEIKEEQISGEETSKDDSQEEQCELGEEGMETSEETDEKEGKQESEEDGEGEKEKQTHVTSDEIKEDENSEKRENDEKDEGPDIQEETAGSTDNAAETKEKEEETVKILGEEEKASDEEKVEESENTENDETIECVENKQEESEAREADKIEGEDENETKTAVQEHNHEAKKSENENENKSEKSEAEENKNEDEDDEEKDITENPAGEGTSETAEETEKSADAGVNETPDGTKSTEETPEFESVEQEAGRAGKTSEKGEIDAENGEISTGAESKNHEDEGEAQPKEENDLKTKEQGEEESKSDTPAEDESADIKELTMASEESAKNHEDDEANQAPGADEVEHDAMEGGDSVEKNDESTPVNSQPETAGTEIKEELKLDDRIDNEETEQDQNGNKSDFGNENKEPDFIKKESSTEGNMDEVTVVSSGNREQSPAPVAVDLSDTAPKLDEENKDAKSDIHPHTAENAVGVDLSAIDGENGGDASKASEEGASVLLKPQAQDNEADNTEQSVAAGQGNPETLGREDNTDLVTNWVNKHQSSKFFETFVEPLEDLREEIAGTPASSSNKEELPRSESPLKVMRMPEDEEKAHTDIENVPQVEEETDMKGLIPKAETEQCEESAASQEMKSDEHKGSTGDMGSLQECTDQKSAKQGINEKTAFSETGVESISGSHHSTTGKPEKTTDNDLSVKQPQTEEGHQSTSPLGTEDINETWEKADKQNREVTETTDFTTSKSDSGSQEERHNEGIEGKASDGSISGDRKELQLIEDIKHTLSKDQLSTFSVDETLLARSSYPLLTAARAESGH